MQILTAQYPTLYTRKFRVTYTDVNTALARRQIIDLFTLPKANQVVSIGMWLESPFKGGGITDSIAGVFSSDNVPAVGATANYMALYRTFNASSQKNGLFQNLVSINSISAPTINQNWCNFAAPTIIQLGLQTDAGHFVTNLNQGSLLVWVTSMRIS